MTVRRFVDDSEVDRSIGLGAGAPVLLVLGAGEPTDPERFAIEHTCKTVADPAEPDGHLTVRCAPSLHPDHRVAWAAGRVTIRASIACPDCGLHGYVTDSAWAGV